MPNTDKIDKQVTRAKIDLMLTNPFWGSLVTRLELRNWDEDTFATDGKYLYVPDAKYYKGWTPQQIQGVVAHETFHCASGHVFRLKDKQKDRWNVAADFATNYILTQNNFSLPQGSLIDSKYAGFTAEKIYGLLPDNHDQGQGQGAGKGSGQGQQGQGQGTSGLKPKDLKEPQGSGNKKDNKDKGNDNGSSGFDPKEMEQDWKEAVTSAARLAKGRGNMPGGMEEYIDAILFPKVPWQELLYHHLQTAKGNTDYTSYPFNRRHIWREIYLPSMQGETIEIVCAIDTSGSIGHEDIVRYLSEIRGIASIFGSYTIHLFQVDTQIHRYDIITEDSEVPKLIYGRGGTSFEPLFEKVAQENLDELPIVYFTDLDGSFPNGWNFEDRVFWLIRKQQNSYRGGHKVPFGTVIEIDD